MNLGIYIHIPFCQSKCNYCHFVSMPFSSTTTDRYTAALLREVDFFADSSDDARIDSIYFGGGTPSLIPAQQIAQILAACQKRFRISEDCEISLEANPGTLSAEKIDSLRRAGVNRVSLGAQSFNGAELSVIGRQHTPEMIAQGIDQLKEGGFANISLDLMLGLPGQTAETWGRNIEAVRHLSVPHLSVYMLDLDERCPLQEMVRSGATRLPEEDLVSDLYLETIGFLTGCGFQQYEISNFAFPGYLCRHNLKYWQREPFHGIGLASHSFDGEARYSNFSRMDDYFNAVEAGKSPVEWRETLSRSQSLAESLFLGLRLTQGINWKQLQDDYGRDSLAQYEPGMREFVQKGLLEWIDSTVRLTPSGMLLSNEIFQLFI